MMRESMLPDRLLEDMLRDCMAVKAEKYAGMLPVSELLAKSKNWRLVQLSRELDIDP